MTKYRALEDVPPHIKKGQVVSFEDPLVGSYKSRFEKVGDDEEETHQTAGDNDAPVKTGIVNPDRNALKAKAEELGINFASNIPTDRLMELIQEAEAKRQDGRGEPSEDGDKDEE